MGKVILCALVALMLSGCVFSSADKSISIYNVGAGSGFGIFGDVVAGGCSVKMNGDPVGVYVRYESKECVVEYGEPLPMSGDL